MLKNVTSVAIQQGKCSVVVQSPQFIFVANESYDTVATTYFGVCTIYAKSKLDFRQLLFLRSNVFHQSSLVRNHPKVLYGFISTKYFGFCKFLCFVFLQQTAL